MTKILYKYRSLENFRNFIDIIVNNRLYAATFKDLNDINEGQYYYHPGFISEEIIERLKQEKNELRICSLSEVNYKELLWAYYANGARGVAIGVIVDEILYKVKKMNYDGITTVKSKDYNDKTAREILSHKTIHWKHEREKRVFTDKEFVKVEIKEIITGKGISESDLLLLEKLIPKINPKIKIIKAETILPKN